LFIWHWVKDYYAIYVIKLGVFITDLIYNVKFDKLVIKDELIFVDLIKQLFTSNGNIADMVITLKIKTSAFTFNFPLTISLFLSILPLVKINKFNVFEVFLFLFIIHFLYVFTLIGLQEYNYLTKANIIKRNSFSKILWEFGWAFTDNLLIRFEPFLVVVYIYLRKGKLLSDFKAKKSEIVQENK
jgi:hypothetical protein